MLSALGKGFALLLGLLVCALVYLYVVAPADGYKLAQWAERGRAGLEEKQIQVGDFNVHYLIGGTGEPLLMLHGFGADKDNWVRMAADLTGSYRVIAPDLPGFGESDHPQGTDYRAVTQATRVHDFVQALGLGQVHVAGNSMGGAIAGAYAAQYPAATRSLSLLAPAGVASAPPSDLFIALEGGGKNPLLPQTNDEFYTLLDQWIFVHEPYIPAPIKFVLAQRAVQRYALLSDIFQQIINEKLALEEKLAGSQVPTLIIWGEGDRLLNPAGAQILAKAIPRAQVVLMPDTGHAPMIERPHKSAAAFKAFAGNLTAGGRGESAGAPASE